MIDNVRLYPATHVLLRPLEVSDAAAVTDYLLRNREPHGPWSPIPPVGFFTEEFQRNRLAISCELRAGGYEYRFGIFVAASGGGPHSLLAGVINLNAIERGVFLNGRFGYSVDTAHGGRGLMTMSLAAVAGFAFGELGLHRLEANIMPRNAASRRVLEKCGFSRVGYSPRMLMINGVWEDHEMWARLADD